MTGVVKIEKNLVADVGQRLLPEVILKKGYVLSGKIVSGWIVGIHQDETSAARGRVLEKHGFVQDPIPVR
jgi:hypothetical protein